MKKYQTDKLALLARLNALEAELLELERGNNHEHDHSGSVCIDAHSVAGERQRLLRRQDAVLDRTAR
jgi:hypothetical protein